MMITTENNKTLHELPLYDRKTKERKRSQRKSKQTNKHTELHSCLYKPWNKGDRKPPGVPSRKTRPLLTSSRMRASNPATRDA